MPIVDDCNFPSYVRSIESVEKLPKVYKTNEMIYRLTKNDAVNIYKNLHTIPLTDLMNINVALKKYLDAYVNTGVLVGSSINYYKGLIEQDKKLEPSKRKFNCDRETFSLTLTSTFYSFFYNVKFTDFREIKSGDPEMEGVSERLSREELRYLNIMKEQTMEYIKQNPDKSKADYIKYAEKLGSSGREVFMKTYKVDPISIRLCEYSYSEVIEVNKVIEAEIEKRKAQEMKKHIAQKAQEQGK